MGGTRVGVGGFGVEVGILIVGLSVGLGVSVGFGALVVWADSTSEKDVSVV